MLLLTFMLFYCEVAQAGIINAINVLLFSRFLLLVFAYSLHMFCKIWLIVSKLYTQANKTQHWEINYLHVCQIETLLSKPNNPLSKCHSDDKMIPTCMIY